MRSSLVLLQSSWDIWPGGRSSSSATTIGTKKRKATRQTNHECYLLKDSLREVFTGDLDPAIVMAMIQHRCDVAADSGLVPFMKAGVTLRGYVNGIHAGATRGLSNGKHEELNNKTAPCPAGPTGSIRLRLTWR